MGRIKGLGTRILVHIFPVFRKIFRFECFCFLVIILKFRESQSHTSNISNIGKISSFFVLKKVLELVKLGKNSCFAYKDLVMKKELIYFKARYFGQQRLQIVQDFHVFGLKSFFLLSIPLKILRQGVNSTICLILVVINSEVVIKKVLNLVDLSGIQTLYIYELSKIVIVGKYKKLILEAF